MFDDCYHRDLTPQTQCLLRKTGRLGCREKTVWVPQQYAVQGSTIDGWAVVATYATEDRPCEPELVRRYAHWWLPGPRTFAQVTA